ncbi:hypothetical protein GDO78_015792 [Eleutherodactylus coqui]|uniref:Uncharacterized protein n=1 Tax=Eleutherodactylus coqui TaxID=57060 RepID=A0A8J6B6W4_ELECQ|nr:hypothetical protein GDO78_015792 [Eleutherodactylus coqui]
MAKEANRGAGMAEFRHQPHEEAGIRELKTPKTSHIDAPKSLQHLLLALHSQVTTYWATYYPWRLGVVCGSQTAVGGGSHNTLVPTLLLQHILYSSNIQSCSSHHFHMLSPFTITSGATSSVWMLHVEIFYMAQALTLSQHPPYRASQAGDYKVPPHTANA